ncbi:TolC family protein, partial [Calditrichota bacterium]
TPNLPMVERQAAKSHYVESDNDSLSLEKAISMALELNPDLVAGGSEIKAQEGRTLQQSLLPNPEFEVEFENFSGSGPFKGMTATETTIAFGQSIELGGKRSKRTNVAALEGDLVDWRFEMKRLEVITNVRLLFTEILAARKKQSLNQELLHISERFRINIDKLVQAGRLSPAELSRANVELAKRQIILQQNQRAQYVTKRKLAATWGADTFQFKTLQGELEADLRLPSVENLLRFLENNPQIIEQQIVIKRQKAGEELAGSESIPEPKIRVGYRRFNESDDQALIAGVSVPIPLFNRNQGGRQEAKFRVRQSVQRLLVIKSHIKNELINRHEILSGILDEIQTIKSIIIPEAQIAYTIIEQNYRQGKYALIDVLDAQRQLFDAQSRYVDSLFHFHTKIIEIERVLGRTLETL